MANQALRQEINLTDTITTSTGTLTANGIAQLDTAQYSSGTAPTYWFEAVYNGAASNTGTIKLRDIAAASNVASLTGATSTTYIVARIQFTPTAGARIYSVQLVGDATRTQNVIAARIIVLQNEVTITQTETQIEIGNQTAALSNTTVADITNPKFWKYTAANWNGTKTFFAEVVYKTSAANTTTITLCNASNTALATIVNAASSTAYTRVRTAGITPVDGAVYHIRALCSSTKSSYTIACAKIIVDQSGLDTASGQVAGDSQATGTSSSSFIQGNGGGSEASGQSFTATESYSAAKAVLYIGKTLTPTDNLILKIKTGSFSGTVIATANTVAAASVGAGSDVDFVFATPPSIASGTKYFLTLERDGTRDTSNYFKWFQVSTSALANGGLSTLSSGVWGAESSTIDNHFQIFKLVAIVEPQFLLLNTAAAGTGAQNMLTTYNASEWDAGTGTIAITHLMDANANLAAAKIVTAAGADTGSSSAATANAAGQFESGAFTLVDATNYDTNETVAGAVASRLKFLYSLMPSAAVAATRRIFISEW